jgi:hypothetical protein
MWVEFTKEEDGRWRGTALNPALNDKQWFVPFPKNINSVPHQLSSKYILATEQSRKKHLDRCPWNTGYVWCDYVRDTNPKNPRRGVHIVKINSLPSIAPKNVKTLTHNGRTCYLPDQTSWSGSWELSSPGAVPLQLGVRSYHLSRDQNKILKKDFWYRFKKSFEWVFRCEVTPLSLDDTFAVLEDTTQQRLLTLFGIPYDRLPCESYTVEMSFSLDEQKSYQLLITLDDEARFMFFFKNPLHEYISTSQNGIPVVKNLPASVESRLNFTGFSVEVEHDFQKTLLSLSLCIQKAFIFHGREYIYQFGGSK